MTIDVQAVWHDADMYSRSEAESWCRSHDFDIKGYRAREERGAVTHHIHYLFDPSEARDGSWRTLSNDFPEGVSVSVCERKTMEVKHVKGTQSDNDPFEFVMSDESVDRVGDVIRAKGWDLKDFNNNPVALWGHNHDKPIGVWENVRVAGKKLIGRLKLAKEGTSAEIDTIRSLVEQRILKSVSVGFQPVKAEPRKGGGVEFISQKLHECSLVAVPANPNALAIAKNLGADPAKIFSLDEGQETAPIDIRQLKPVEKQTGGKLANSNPQVKGKHPMNIQEKLDAKQERLIAIKDELTEVKALMESDEAEDLSSEQIDRIDALTEEQDAVIKSIEALNKIEANLAKKAQPVQKAQAMNYGTSGQFPVEEKGGALLAKAATVDIIAHMERKRPEQVIAERYSHDDRVKAVHGAVNKTAVLPADTTTAGWAAELVQQDIRGFMYDMQPISVYAALRAQGLALDFGKANSITIPSRAAADRGLAPAFVGEGGVIPVGKMSLTSKTLNRYKVAVISNFTNELLEQSTPNIETLVRQAILDDTAHKLDTALLDNAAAVAGVRPAGLLNGVTPAASAGATAADIITDLKVLLNAMAAANLGAKPVIIMNSARLLGLSTVTNATGSFMFRDEARSGTLLGVPVISSSNVPAASVIIVDADSFAAANAAPEFAVSDQATIVQANADGTAPSMAGDATDYTGGDLGTAGQVPTDGGIIVTGNGTGAPSGTAVANYQALSMYQVYSTAVRMVLPTSWATTRANAVASLSGVAW